MGPWFAGLEEAQLQESGQAVWVTGEEGGADARSGGRHLERLDETGF